MSYGMIAEIGNRLTELLCRELVPEVLQHRDHIGLCSPDNHGDIRLGIYLYDVSENEEMVVPGMVDTGVRTQTYPSSYLTLGYMITAYSESDLKFRAAEEQRILGRVVQTLRDNSVFAEGTLEGSQVPVRIELQRIKSYEKLRLWNFPNVPYKLSLFYRVYPVEIRSARTREITRVREVEFAVRENAKTGGGSDGGR